MAKFRSQHSRKRLFTDDTIHELVDALEAWLLLDTWIYIGEFCADFGISRQSLFEYTQAFSALQAVYARAIQISEARLVKLAASRKLDGNFVKFLMTNLHGWKEKPEVSITTNVSVSKLLDDIDGKSKGIIDVTPTPIPIPHQPLGS